MEKVCVNSSGLSCTVDEVPWQSFEMKWNTEAQVERCKESSK